MKRVLSLVVAVVLTFSVLNVTWVYAIEPYEMQPNYIGVATMKPGLTLNTGGLMTCTDNIEIKTGYTAKVVWSLQYQSNRNWISTQTCNGVQREHNKKLNNGLPILHKVPPKRDYGRYFCIMAEKGGTSHGGLTEKLSLFFHAKKQEVNAYGR